jgi:hypothetical protein
LNVFQPLIVLLGLALASFSAGAAPSPEKFGFKGIELGSGIAAVANNPKYECHTASTPAADTICGLRAQEKETMAGAPVNTLFFFFYDGKLTSIAIHLEEKHFAQVVDALRGKYGDTPVQAESIRNLKGLVFENRTYTWKTPGETLTAQRYSGRVDQSSIRFKADELIRRIEQHRNAVARDPRKDL